MSISNLLKDIYTAVLSPFYIGICFTSFLMLQFWILITLITLLAIFWVLFVVFCRSFLKVKSSKLSIPGDSRNFACRNSLTIGFFHPYCNAGGGGERVLWCAIRALQSRYDFVKCVVYTGDVSDKSEEIIQRAKDRFNIEIKRPVHFVYLHQRNWVTAKRYPIFTLLGQSFGSLILGFEALFKFTPDVYLDTMGYAFTIPVFKYLGGCHVGSYVHYPTISTDMLEKVIQRQVDFNHASFISQSAVLSHMKVIYYHIFAFCYGLCGQCNDVVMVNSSWTLNHINALWKIADKTKIIYPPCDTKSLLNIPIDSEESLKKRPRQIVSVSQFRPEKNHSLQLKIFAKFLKELPPQMKTGYKLLLIGSCRGNEDNDRVANLKVEAKSLKIDKYVEFHLNVSYDTLIGLLTTSTVGLHTMKDEHFGIGVVEFMAAGLVTLANNSAGPKMDIVIDWNGARSGYLASTLDEYVHALQRIFKMAPVNRYELCLNARDCVKKRFSEDNFKRHVLAETEILIK